ncbi:MAG: hypothetical protein AAFP26_07295 [Planctomycetota bacterium]
MPSVRLPAVVGALAGLGVVFASSTLAQPTLESVPARATAEMPQPEAIFERYIEVIGGRDALDALKNREIRGVYEGPPFELPARLYMYQEKPNSAHLKIEQPFGGTIEISYDGQTGWERANDGTIRALTGLRLGEFIDTADFLGEANYKNRYAKLETVGESNLFGRNVWLVAAEAPGGRTRRLAFDKETGLFSGTITPSTTAQGERLIVVTVDNYQDAGGVLYPTLVEQRIVGQEGVVSTFRYNSIVTNIEGEHDFSAPGEILQPGDPAPAND